MSGGSDQTVDRSIALSGKQQSLRTVKTSHGLEDRAREEEYICRYP